MGNLASARANMVTGQILTSDVQDTRVLGALNSVMRERFLPPADAAMAYADVEAPIEGGRALLMPLTFARLLQIAKVGAGDFVLDVGCGTGYSTAVLARLAGSVVALESAPELAKRATSTLSDLGVDNAAIIQGPLAAGYAAEAPFDVIFLNGSVNTVPGGLLDQLAPGGRLVAIIGAGAIGRATVMTNHDGGIGQRQAFDASATPLPGFPDGGGFVF